MEFFCSLIVKKVSLVLLNFDSNYALETQTTSHYWTDCKKTKSSTVTQSPSSNSS